jgi:tetratricopeptide (TPR) repeat protein
MTYELGLEKLRSGDLQGALKLFDQAIQSPTTPDLAPIYCQRGQLRARLGDNFGAIADYSQSLNLAPSAAAYLGRAIVQFSLQGHRVAILDAQQALVFDFNLAPAHEVIAKAHGSRNPAQAIEAYRQAAKLYLAQGDANRARSCLTEATELRAAQRRPSPIAGVPLRLAPTPPEFLTGAIAKFKAQAYTEAFDDLTWLISCEPDNAEVLAWRSIVQAHLKREQGAIDDITRAMAIAPTPQIRKQRGQMRLILGDSRGTIADCDALMAEYEMPIAPEAYADYAAIFILRGQAQLQLQDPDRAFKDFCNAIALAPNPTSQAEAHEGRAQAQSSSDPEAAISDYQTAARHWLDHGNLPRHHQAKAAAASLQQAQTEQQEAQKNARTLRIPIVCHHNDVPYVQAQVNGHRALMCINTGCSTSILGGDLARELDLKPQGMIWVRLADGRVVELPIARLRSLDCGLLKREEIWVAFTPEVDHSVLGQDILSGYDVHILEQEIELVRRE